MNMKKKIKYFIMQDYYRDQNPLLKLIITKLVALHTNDMFSHNFTYIVKSYKQLCTALIIYII